MSCYVTFYYGDLTNIKEEDNFNYNKAPCLLSLTSRNELGECFTIFEADKPTLVTKDHIERIREKVDYYIESVEKDIQACREIKQSILNNINQGDYDENTYRINQCNQDIDELTADIDWAKDRLGALSVVEELLDKSYQVTVIIG